MENKRLVYEVGELSGLREEVGKGVMLFGVIGDPIEHSVSPGLHGKWIEEEAKRDERFKGGRYVRVRVREVELGEGVNRLYELGFVGVNVTLPHKVGVMQYLGGVETKVGAVNTLYRKRGVEGYMGTNTDVLGVAAVVKRHWGLEWGKEGVLIVGTGGSAQGLVGDLIEKGARRVWVMGRREEGIEGIRKTVMGLGDGEVIGVKDVREVGGEIRVIINCTPLGMKEGDGFPVNLEGVDTGVKLVDMVYRRDRVDTEWIEYGRGLGLEGVSGMEVLEAQGRRSFEIWVKSLSEVES